MPAGSSSGSKKYSEAELSAMTKAQISDLAAGLGYGGIQTTMTKAAMISAFLAAQGG